VGESVPRKKEGLGGRVVLQTVNPVQVSDPGLTLAL
jgi:hypothetical protein